MEEDYERILLVKPDVYIYKIPPRTTTRAYRANEWKLDEPDWIGRLKLISKGDDCILKLEEKTSGQLFAKCPIDAYPGSSIEPVSDSSRYFVIKIVNDDKRYAFIGIGFNDRGDSFDLNVALQDHFKSLHKEVQENNQTDEGKPKLDLQLKEGQTIKVNLNISKKPGATATNRTKPKPNPGQIGILPPPPGGIKLPPPAKSTSKSVNETESKCNVSNHQANNNKLENDLLVDFNNINLTSNANSENLTSNNNEKSSANDLWTAFQ